MSHALLSPSSSERWINCPPSAKENADGNTGSSYAQQGSEAHLLAESKVKKALGQKVRDPTEELEYFDNEMAEHTDAYCEFIMEQVEIAALFGGWDSALVTLIIFMGIDFATGLITGAMGKSKHSKTGKLNSKAGITPALCGFCRNADRIQRTTLCILC